VTENGLDTRIAAGKNRNAWLPLLVVLFLVSYGLMALLVFEQDRTIASQRGLITDLLGDSTQLSALKGQIIQKKNLDAQANAGSQAKGLAPKAQTPSSPAAPADKAKGGHDGRPLAKSAPQKPPTAASDRADVRRTVVRI
jgi:hypothetical protein